MIIKCLASSISLDSAAGIAGVGLTNNAGVLDASNVPNGALANSSVSYGGVTVSLGASDATPAFDLSDATSYPGDSSLVTAGALNAGSITSGFGSINNGLLLLLQLVLVLSVKLLSLVILKFKVLQLLSIQQL